MEQQDINTILDKYKTGIASEEEIALLESWYLGFTPQVPEENLSEEERLQTFNEVWANLTKAPVIKNTKKLWPRIIAAASILFFLSAGGYYLLNRHSDEAIVKIQTHDIIAGSNKAILTLANGKKIILNDTKNDEIIHQGKAALTKLRDGHIVYQASDEGMAANLVYNTITTPRGGKYRITLADGTNVWLNAASSVTYPTTFSETSRTVEITGEAYFEVTHNAAKPFRVKCYGQIVEVLGTHFNINSYDDEATVKTTLLEGSVKIITGEHFALLHPGQQSEVSIAKNATGIFKGVKSADTDEAVAWKNELFAFDKADIKTVMRQFSRWYDVEVIYKGNIDKNLFSGSIHRELSLAKALELLTYANVHFIIDGKKIIVSNK